MQGIRFRLRFRFRYRRKAQAWRGITHPRDDVLVVSKMRLACLATVDLVAGEVGVVGQAHCCGTG